MRNHNTSFAFRFATAALLFCLTQAMAVLPAAARGLDAGCVAAMLVNQDRMVRQAGLDAVDVMGQSLLPGFLALSKNGNTELRRGAVIGMALLPTPGLAQDAFIAALHDPDATVRSLAAHSLARIGPRVAPELTQLLARDDECVRVGAALALSKMGKAAVPALADALGQGSIMLTAKAAWLLGSLGTDAMGAVPALIRTLDSDDMRLVHLVCETIDQIGPDPALVNHELTLLDAQTGCPVTQVGGNAAPSVVKLLARPGTPMAHIGLYTLTRMGNAAEPALRATLATGSDSQKAAAALILTGIDPTMAASLPPEMRRTLSGHTD